jgi:hypothetical protein
MPLLDRADYDAALVEAIDDLPDWAMAALDNGVIRVEQAPCADGLAPERGLRVVVYREPSLLQARNRDELRRLARADLARAVVWQLDMGEQRVREFAVAALVA